MTKRMVLTDSGKLTSSPKKGFAAMPPERRREVAVMGGRRAHQNGTAHVFNSEEAREAARLSGISRAAKRAK